MTTSESKGRFFYKTNRFESIRVANRTESIRITNWNALVVGIVQRRRLLYSGHVVRMQKERVAAIMLYGRTTGARARGRPRHGSGLTTFVMTVLIWV